MEYLQLPLKTGYISLGVLSKNEWGLVVLGQQKLNCRYKDDVEDELELQGLIGG